MTDAPKTTTAVPATPAQIAKLPTQFAGLPVKQPTEIQQHRGMCLSLSGKAGVGKTTLAAEIIKSPIVQRALFVDIEGGSHVLDDEQYEAGYKPEEGPKVGIIEVTNHIELDRVMNQLVQNPGPFNCAIFDNMSEALEIYKAKYNFYAKQEDQLGKWNSITNDMVELARKGRDLARARRFITIYCMWDTQESEDDAGVKFKHRGLHFNPKLAEKFMGIIDMAGWLESQPKPLPPYPPILHFDVDPLYPTKKRVSPRTQALTKIPEIHYHPSLADIADTLMDGKPFPLERHAKSGSARPS